MNSVSQSKLLVEPIAGALGAEVGNVDLSNVNQTVINEIRAAFTRYHVLVFRDQSLSPKAQKEFAKYFGPLETHPYIQGLQTDPEVVAIIKEPDETVNFGGGGIQTCRFFPPLGSVLYALEVPHSGGDTLFLISIPLTWSFRTR